MTFYEAKLPTVQNNVSIPKIRFLDRTNRNTIDISINMFIFSLVIVYYRISFNLKQYLLEYTKQYLLCDDEFTSFFLVPLRTTALVVLWAVYCGKWTE